MIVAFRMIVVAIVAVAAAAVFPTAAQVPQTPPPRDSATEKGAAPGGIVRGRITAAVTGQPLHRVRVTLDGAIANPPTAVTDTAGVFEMRGVPPGRYTVTAVRAGYLTVQYGQRRPRDTGRPIEVRGAEPLDGIDVAMVRGGVVAGRVVDEVGEPAPGARVEALEMRYIRGRRLAVPARIATTNDAGEYRLSSLEPGTYQLRTSTRDVWESDDGRESFVHAVTYFPNVLALDQAEVIRVTAAQEVAGLDIRLVPGRAARITGVVQNAAGEPQAGQPVNVSEIGRTIGGALRSSGPGPSGTSDAQGAFDFGRLAPGEYMVSAGSGSERADVSVVVGSGDSRHVVLSPRKPTRVSGKVVTDDGSPPPFGAPRLSVSPIDVDPERVLPAWGSPGDESLRADWSFQIPNLDGAYLFRVSGMPDDWTLKSVTADNRDVTDVPLRVIRGGADVSGLQIVVSRTGATLNGEVRDGNGGAVADAMVILFAENRALWIIGSRYVRMARTDRQGRFRVAGVPPSAYRVVARDFIADGEWEDAQFLDRALKDAVRVELKDATTDKIVVTLTEAR